MSALEAQIDHWLKNPADFVRDNFKVQPDRWQEKALEQIAGEGVHKLALRACAGPGKSAVMAWAIWWFMSLHAYGNEFPKAVCLSNTRENLRDNLWSELHKWRDTSEFIKSQFAMNSDRAFHVKHPERWSISARSFAQSATPEEMGETLSGLHADFCAVFLDESGAMHPSILKRASQAMTSVRYGLIMQAGNPLSREGCLWEAEKDESWMKVRITGDPDDPDRSPRVNLELAKEAIAKYGRADAWVMAYILGEFPESAFNGLLSEIEVEAAMGKVLRRDVYLPWGKRIGGDIARFGDDRTVLFPRQGPAAFTPVILRGQDGPKVARRLTVGVQRFARLNGDVPTTPLAEAQEVRIYVDDTGGYGGSVIDHARIEGLEPIAVNMSGKAADPARFFNIRAELHWRAAEWVKKGGALPAGIEGLAKEAAATQYTMEGNRIKMEPKESVKRRIGRSPDLWDAFTLTFYHPDDRVGLWAMPVEQASEEVNLNWVPKVPS